MGYLHFQIGCIFAKYDLFKPAMSIQNCIYMNFRINLTQFYINFSRDITFMGRDKRAEVISFQPLPPFIFPLNKGYNLINFQNPLY